MKNKKLKINKLQQNKGITLISLVITIIVLLILAAISIGMLLGENGILTRANEASEATKYATAEEKVKIAVLGSYDITGKLSDELIVDELYRYETQGMTSLKDSEDNKIEKDTTDINGKYPIKTIVDGYEFTIAKTGIVTGDKTSTGDNETTGTPSIEDAETVLSETENTVVEDEFGNAVTIPAGFIVSTDSGKNVTEGIVAEDNIGNQFVWVPVGTIKTDNSGGTKTIELSRYEFAEDGTATKKGLTEDINSYSEVSYENEETEYLEEQISSYGTTVAKDLNEFILKTEASGGYYIARYEASQGINGKVESKANQEEWSGVQQYDAAIAAKEMYTSSKYTSDLMNSLSWDTALVYIQTFSGDIDYSMEMHKYDEVDVRLNIYNMASNVSEWTTETNKSNYSPCVFRGSSVGVWYIPSSGRQRAESTLSFESYPLISFRPLLYL